MTITVILSYATGMLAQPPPNPTPPPQTLEVQVYWLTTPSPLPPPPKKFELGTLLKDHDANIMHQT